MLIAQATPTGEVALSGYTMDGPTFQGVEIDEESIQPRIDRIHVPPSGSVPLRPKPAPSKRSTGDVSQPEW